jgi:hypothetical protein
MIKLYREGVDGVFYWEAWDDGSGTAVVHEGRVGDRGRSTEVHDVDDFDTWVARAANAKRAEGFDDRAEEDLEIVAIQVPRASVPADLDAFEAMWDRLEHWSTRRSAGRGSGAARHGLIRTAHGLRRDRQSRDGADGPE